MSPWIMMEKCYRCWKSSLFYFIDRSTATWYKEGTRWGKRLRFGEKGRVLLPSHEGSTQSTPNIVIASSRWSNGGFARRKDSPSSARTIHPCPRNPNHPASRIRIWWQKTREKIGRLHVAPFAGRNLSRVREKSGERIARAPSGFSPFYIPSFALPVASSSSPFPPSKVRSLLGSLPSLLRLLLDNFLAISLDNLVFLPFSVQLFLKSLFVKTFLFE